MRSIIDLCMKHPEGKYVLVKDPNKVRPCFTLFPATESHPILGDRADPTRGTFPPTFHAFVRLKSRKRFINPLVRQPVIRLYSVPANAFTEEEEEEGAEDVDEPELVA